MRAAFEVEAVPAEVEGGYSKPRPGLAWGEGDEPEWIIRIVLAYGIVRFLDGFLTAAGADAWKALKHLAERLREARHSNPPWQGSIQFREPNGRETIVPMLPEPPSDEAWRTLFELDWDSLPESDWLIVQWHEHDRTWVAFVPSTTGKGASLYWDRDARKWRKWDQGQPPGQRQGLLERLRQRFGD